MEGGERLQQVRGVRGREAAASEGCERERGYSK